MKYIEGSKIEFNIHDLPNALKALRKRLLKLSYESWVDTAKEFEGKKKPGTWPWRYQYYSLKEAMKFVSYKSLCYDGRYRHNVIEIINDELCTINYLLKLEKCSRKNTKVYLNLKFAAMLSNFMPKIEE